MSSLWLDVQYAMRMMVKAPGLAAVLVITLALGVGASTTIFSVVHSLLLRPLPYDKPDELVRVYTEFTRPRVERHWLEGPEYADLRDACRSCASIGMWYRGFATLGGGDRPVLVDAAFSTASLLPTLGVKPMLGRWFDASEDPQGEAQAAFTSRHVVVLSHAVWKRVFAGDPSLIGRKITLEALPITVIGVMPPGFFLDGVDAWVPAARDPMKQRRGSGHSHHVIARLKPGVSIDAFRDELVALSVRWGALDGPDHHAITPVQLPGVPAHPMVAFPLHGDVLGSLGMALWLLQGAALFVLLIAVVNIANLLLARAEGRTREVAVRHALGASRRRLMRQFMTESLMLGTLGGALGILVAVWAVDGVTALLPASAPRASEIELDGTAVAFAVACTVAASLLFGMAPILHARRTDLHGALKDGSPRMTGSKARLRARRALVIAEIALAVVLVVGCTVMVRSFVRLQRVDLGFRPDHLLSFQIRLPYATYPGGTPSTFWERALDRLRALPGVTGVTLLDDLPPSRPPRPRDFRLPGRAQAPGEQWVLDYLNTVGDHFATTLGARLLGGRDLLPSDTGEAPPVCLINEALARRYFPGEDPVGRPIEIFVRGPDRPQLLHTIVGVIADIKQQGIDSPAGIEVFLPMRQYSQVLSIPSGKAHSYVVVRTERDAASYGPAVTRVLAEIDPALPVAKLGTMDDLMWQAIARPRFLSFLLGCFAALALVLAAVGIYGVMAHTVALRTHEIGLRVALGASPAQVRAMVLRKAGALVGAGVATGLGAAIALQLALDSSLRGLFYGDALSQPLLLAGVAAAVAGTALFATWVPARRATEVEPTVALRIE